MRKRRIEVSKSWPGGKRKQGFSQNQKSCQSQNPSHLLSGSMTCSSCGSAITQVSGKGGGYFGCLSALKGTCSNKIKVQRKLAENVILKEICKQLASPENFRHVLKQVEKEVAKTYSDVPNLIW